MADVPEEVRRLLAEREARRAERDFGAADEIRGKVHALGFEIEDSPEGPRVVPARPLAEDRLQREAQRDAPYALEGPSRFDFTVTWMVQGWPEDVIRGMEAFRRWQGSRSVQYVVADAAGADWPPEGSLVIDVDPALGWAAGMNAALRRSAGRIVLVADGSIEPDGDVFGPLERALADPAVGVAGPFGVVTEDLREFRESGGPRVDGIEGYLMAFRREVLADAGLFDEKFRFYRTADIELSFRIKDRGLEAIRTPLPVIRHEHRVWESTSPRDRDRFSKRNYYRFLDRWRGRLDLCVGVE